MSLSNKELELFESVEFYLALLGALPLPVFMVDNEDNCHTLSDLNKSSFEKLASIVPDRSKNIWHLDINDDQSILAKAVREARKHKKYISVKGKWKYKKSIIGNEIMVVVHAVPAEIGGKEYIILSAEDTTELEKLKGLLPICMQCNKIYNNQTENWDRLETYISKKTTAGFSHGLCPECSSKAIHDLKESNWGKGDR